MWRSPTEASVFLVPEGSLWFIPEGALHSLNCTTENAVLLIGFSSDNPSDFDLPVAYNGLPQTIRRAYTSPGHHQQLAQYVNSVFDPLTGYNPIHKPIPNQDSPYKWTFNRKDFLFENKRLGSVAWVIQDHWPTLKDSGISFIRSVLKPNVTRDAIWWPSASCLYVVARGTGIFTLVFSGWLSQPIKVTSHDMVFVPQGVMHTYENRGLEDLEIIGFFNVSNPLPEVSLIVATNFFPKSIANSSLTLWGNKTPATIDRFPNCGSKTPLNHLLPFTSSPYLLAIPPLFIETNCTELNHGKPSSQCLSNRPRKNNNKKSQSIFNVCSCW